MSVKVEWRADRKRWQVTYHLDGKRKRPLFVEEAAAVNFARKIEMGLQIEDLKSITIDDAGKQYYHSDSSKKDQKSRANDRRYINLHFHFMLYERGIERLSSVALIDVEAFRDWLLTLKFEPWNEKTPMRMGPSTVNRCLRVISRFYKRHVQWKNIQSNPCQHLELLDAEEKPRAVMTMAHYLAAFQKAPEWFRPVLRFVMLTGAPNICIERLMWSDVDLVARRYFVWRKKGRKAKVKRVPMAMSDAVFAEFVLLRNADPASDGYVFQNEFGRKLRADRITKLATRALRDAGIEGVTIYGLRHALAADMTTAGIPTEIVRQAMGHASITTTQRYANKVQLTAISGALNSVRGGSELPPEEMEQRQVSAWPRT